MFQKVFLRTTRARRFRSGIIALCAIGAIVLVAVGASPLLALGPVTMRVDPVTRAVPVNGTFTVDIVADVGTEMDATEPDKTGGLGAYEFDLVDALGYTEVITATDDRDLGSTGRTVGVLGPNISATDSTTVTFAAVSYPPEDVDGPKDTVVLATVELQAKRAGVTTLSLENALMTDTEANAWPDGATRVLNTSGADIFVFMHSDFDGDGEADPAAYRPNTGNIEAYLSDSGYAKFEQWVGPDGDVVTAVADYDGDGVADPAAFRPSTGNIEAYLSGSSYTKFEQLVGPSNAVPAVGDYDGDGKTDPAAFDPSTGNIVAYYSSEGYATPHEWWVGPSHAVPVIGDYDGDGKADPAAYADGKTTIRRSSLGYNWFKPWVGSNATPLVGDYDGDGKADPAAYRPWDCKILVRRSSFGYDWFKRFIGCTNTIPLVADYDSDGKIDLAAYRGGKMLIRRSSLDYLDWWEPWIGSNAEPMVGDYDGDGLADPAAYRSDGKIRVRRSSFGYDWAFLQWVGSNADPIDYWQVQ